MGWVGVQRTETAEGGGNDKKNAFGRPFVHSEKNRCVVVQVGMRRRVGVRAAAFAPHLGGNLAVRKAKSDFNI